MMQSNRFRSGLRSGARWAVAVALVAMTAWATPPTMPFDDLGGTYQRGQITEARALGRKYLVSAEAAVKAAKTDSERSLAVRRLLRVAQLSVGSEAQLPIAGRFRNSMDLLAQIEQAVITAELVGMPIDESKRVFATVGLICSDWLIATRGFKSRTEQAAFFDAHREELAMFRVRSLDEPLIVARSTRADLGMGGIDPFVTLATQFTEAYVARDTAGISSATKISENDVVNRIKAGRLQYFASSTDRIVNIAFQPITIEFVSNSPGLQNHFTIYLQDVVLQLASSDGTAYSKSVDRVLYVVRDISGGLKIEMPSEGQEEGVLR